MSSSLESSVVFLHSFNDTSSASSTHVERFKPDMVYVQRSPVMPLSAFTLPFASFRRPSQVFGPLDCYGFLTHMAITTSSALFATLSIIAIPTSYSMEVKDKCWEQAM